MHTSQDNYHYVCICVACLSSTLTSRRKKPKWRAVFRWYVISGKVSTEVERNARQNGGDEAGAIDRWSLLWLSPASSWACNLGSMMMFFVFGVVYVSDDGWPRRMNRERSRYDSKRPAPKQGLIIDDSCDCRLHHSQAGESKSMHWVWRAKISDGAGKKRNKEVAGADREKMRGSKKNTQGWPRSSPMRRRTLAERPRWVRTTFI